MDHSKKPVYFDGHNDVLTRILQAGGVTAAKSFLDGMPGHLDLEKISKGGFGGGFFAMWVASPSDGSNYQQMMEKVQYDVPLPPMLDSATALRAVEKEKAILLKLEELGALRICTSVQEISDSIADDTLAAIMHLEGAEAIDPEFAALESLHASGLRSLGPVWSRPTIFAEGVPFRFPSSPDTGNGLTPLGIELIKRCNHMGIMIDLSHLNEAGFWDVQKYSSAPLVATHSNAHTLCNHARNLTDKQLAAIGESGGLVGLNFAASFLREDGRMHSDIPLTQIIRHLDHMIDIAGEDCVGFGSDFDGAVVPREIGDASGLPKLRLAMRTAGYSEELMQKLCVGNWLRLLDLTWKN